MFRPAASRTLLLRYAISSTTTAPLNPLLLRNQPRLLSTSTAAAAKRSTFKGTVARWTLAGALIYWYSTSSVFADEPKFQEDLPPASSETETDRPPSLLPTKPLRPSRSPDDDEEGGEDATSGAEALEAEAGQEGAFNPETGEINWDCPCLGGMAHGPCGDEFKAAFSCFVFSTEEPKGVDCIEKFKGMQACFQQHPDVYGSELDDDDDEGEPDAPPPTTPDDTPLTAPDGTPPAAKPSSSSSSSSSPSPGSAAATAPTATGDIGSASRGGETDPAVTEAKTAPGLAEPSRSVRDTPVLQQAHRGDAKARSISDPPTQREAEIAGEDA